MSDSRDDNRLELDDDWGDLDQQGDGAAKGGSAAKAAAPRAPNPVPPPAPSAPSAPAAKPPLPQAASAAPKPSIPAEKIGTSARPPLPSQPVVPKPSVLVRAPQAPAAPPQPSSPAPPREAPAKPPAVAAQTKTATVSAAPPPPPPKQAVPAAPPSDPAAAAPLPPKQTVPAAPPSDPAAAAPLPPKPVVPPAPPSDPAAAPPPAKLQVPARPSPPLEAPAAPPPRVVVKPAAPIPPAPPPAPKAPPPSPPQRAAAQPEAPPSPPAAAAQKAPAPDPPNGSPPALPNGGNTASHDSTASSVSRDGDSAERSAGSGEGRAAPSGGKKWFDLPFESRPSRSRSSSSAARDSAPKTQGVANSLCVFWLGNQCFALDTAVVREAVSIDTLAPVPLAPAPVLGLFNLRGVPVSLVDLAALLDLPHPPRDFDSPGHAASVALVVQSKTLLTGVLVDRMEVVLPAGRGRFARSSADQEEAYVAGFLELADRDGFVATVLDPAALEQRFESLKFR
jgi:chemotaxis signal transduction protein